MELGNKEPDTLRVVKVLPHEAKTISRRVQEEFSWIWDGLKEELVEESVANEEVDPLD